MIYTEYFWYVAPFIWCVDCMKPIRIPYPSIPQTNHDQWSGTEYISPLVSPPDSWRVLLGCRECGLIGTYSEEDLGESVVEKTTLGKFQSETNCYSVELRCAQAACKSPSILHADMKDGETERDLIRLLRANFFHGALPCGHELMPIGEALYRDAHRVMNRLW